MLLTICVRFNSNIASFLNALILIDWLSIPRGCLMKTEHIVEHSSAKRNLEVVGYENCQVQSPVGKIHKVKVPITLPQSQQTLKSQPSLKMRGLSLKYG